MTTAGVIFDGDDTLWETMPAYAEAKREFCEEMGLLGFNPTDALHTLEIRFRILPSSAYDGLRAFAHPHPVAPT